MSDFLLFSGNSHPKFAQEVADYLGSTLGRIKFEPFPDGEISVQILDNVRGRDVFVFQTVAIEPNNYLMELLIIIDALKRASAKSISAIIPYFGYARQDRKDKPRVPITAKLVANLLSTAGASRIVTMDLHAGQIQGFFDIPVDNLYGRPILAKALAKEGLKDFVIMAPDLGAIKKARAYASHFNADFALIDKRRITTEKVEAYAVIGNVENRDVVLVDDMCSTAGTLVAAASSCRAHGARRIFAAVTHGLFVGKALQNIENSLIEKLFASNTVSLARCSSPKIKEISVASLFGDAIRCIISNESISSLFADVGEVL